MSTNWLLARILVGCGCFDLPKMPVKAVIRAVRSMTAPRIPTEVLLESRRPLVSYAQAHCEAGPGERVDLRGDGLRPAGQ